MFEVKKGDYVDCEGFSKAQRKAVFAKFEALGFPKYGADDGLAFIGVDLSGDSLDVLAKGRFERKITLEQLMFCDQPDDVTHCYFLQGDLIYSKEARYADQHLICTREAKDSRSWYEKGELPPERIVVEVLHNGHWVSAYTVGEFGLHKKCMVCAPNGGGFYGYYAEKIRPIQSERDKLIKRACEVCFAPKSDSTIRTVEALVDAGMLRMPEDGAS